MNPDDAVPDPATMLAAYTQGVFPMAQSRGGPVEWFEARERCVIDFVDFHVPRRLRRTLRSHPYTVLHDHAFAAVVEACAAPGPGRDDTWISPALAEAYQRLHRAGHAHSVELWWRGSLVGGVFGVSVGGLFAAESMFSRVRDASKIALVQLVAALAAGGRHWMDVQLWNPHLAQFRPRRIEPEAYRQRLAAVLPELPTFPPQPVSPWLWIPELAGGDSCPES